ncbi:MAG TPA: efflux transporter outer membrane subunit [Steroidobacteraceae bacterium]|nr:efflux transporter outer membrane subunit [Steroidobacteraceae bacterium]
MRFATSRHAPRCAAAILLAAACSRLAGCAVGPNFQPPAPPAGEQYHPPPAAPIEAAAQDRQQLAAGEIRGLWWQLFRSAALDQAVREALANSPTLVAANATLAQAREAVIVAQAGLLPHASAAAGAQRSSARGALLPAGQSSTSNLYTVGASASYSVDLFGGVRRAVEESRALADVQRYQLAAAYLTLTGNVIQEALTIASTRLQIDTTQQLIESDRKNLALTQREFEVGTATRADVLTADAQLAGDLTTLPALREQLAEAYDALDVLIGRPPAQGQPHAFDIQELSLPREVPLSLPSQLVRQRPDVLAAEAQLHASSAAIGVATAQLFPALTLTAGLSREALQAGGLFHQFDSLWNVGGSLAQPIFEGGALRAQVRAARDAFQAQAATYRNTVLEALGQVADDLWALQYDAERLTVDRHSVDIAAESLKLQQQSYQVGTTNVLNLINAERAYAQARLSYATAQVQQFQDTAGLLVALGGAWWQDPAAGPPGAAH